MPFVSFRRKQFQSWSAETLPVTRVEADGKIVLEMSDDIIEKVEGGELYIVPRDDPVPKEEIDDDGRGIMITAIDIYEYP